MLISAASALFTNVMMREQQRPVGWVHFPGRYLPAALFLMPAVMHAAMLPTAAAMGRLQWQHWLKPGTDGLYHSPASRGWGVLTAAGLAQHIAINAIVGMIICDDAGAL